MNNKPKEPNFKTGLFYVLFEDTLQDAIKNKNKTLSIIEKGKEVDDEPYILKRGNIFPTQKALRNNPNDTLIFDIIDSNELLGSFRGFLYPDGTLNGKIIWRTDLEDSNEENILKGYYKYHSKHGIKIYGFWTAKAVTNGFYATLQNDIVTKKKTNKATTLKKIKNKNGKKRQ